MEHPSGQLGSAVLAMLPPVSFSFPKSWSNAIFNFFISLEKSQLSKGTVCCIVSPQLPSTSPARKSWILLSPQSPSPASPSSYWADEQQGHFPLVSPCCSGSVTPGYPTQCSKCSSRPRQPIPGSAICLWVVLCRSHHLSALLRCEYSIFYKAIWSLQLKSDIFNFFFLHFSLLTPQIF